MTIVTRVVNVSHHSTGFTVSTTAALSVADSEELTAELGGELGAYTCFLVIQLICCGINGLFLCLELCGTGLVVLLFKT